MLPYVIASTIPCTIPAAPKKSSDCSHIPKDLSIIHSMYFNQDNSEQTRGISYAKCLVPERTAAPEFSSFGYR